jgi:hypothetical protein
VFNPTCSYLVLNLVLACFFASVLENSGQDGKPALIARSCGIAMDIFRMGCNSAPMRACKGHVSRIML